MPFYPRGFFPLHRSWLARGLRIGRDNPDLLASSNRDDISIDLGIGVRKVDSLVDWMRASGLLETEPNRRLSNLAELIAEHDPALEEPGTWWAIHLQLCSDPEQMGIYYWFINRFRMDRFDRDTVRSRAVRDWRDEYSERSIESAVWSVLGTLENTPLGASPGLLMQSENDSFVTVSPDEDLLPISIFAYALVRWAQGGERETAAIEELDREGAPGRTLNLTGPKLDDFIDRAQSMYGGEVITVSRTAGLNSIAFRREHSGLDLLSAYYKQRLEGLSPLESLRTVSEEGN